MKKHFLFLLCFVHVQLLAQNTPCATDQMVKKITQQNPHIKQLFERAEHKASLSISQNKTKTYNAVVTIPVVVHVVWNTAQQNISDEQILSQIDVLNEDFRKLTADTSVIRPIFKPFAGDSKIQFCLAQRDPNGNYTNGITRTFTNVTSFGCDDQVKFDTAGGKTGWDPSRYLNIWVCNLNCANGYAYYPGIPPQYDGVVVHYYVFGRTGYVAPGYKGRTCSHEVGHWLGLYHPFIDGCEGSTAQTCAVLGDKVCDTPKDSTPTWTCNPSLNTCIDTPVDYPDMYENIMDYTTDNCRCMFTHGQIDRMHSFLYTLRATLFTSLGCIPPGTNWHNAVALSITHPPQEFCKTSFSPKIIIGNGSTDTLKSLQIYYRLDNEPEQLYSWTGAIPSGGFSEITLPVINTVPGYHQLTVTTQLPNSYPDDYPADDVTSHYFYLMGPADGVVVPYHQGFEEDVFPPSGWFLQNPDNDNSWRHSVFYGGYGNSTRSAYFPNSSTWPDGTHDYLLSPWFNLTNESNRYLNFDYAYSKPDPAYVPWFCDTLSIWYSTNCSENWVLLWKKGGDSLATAPPVVPFAPFKPSDNQWKTISIKLDGVTGNPLVQFRFDNYSDFGNDLYIDNIYIGESLAGIREKQAYSDLKIYPTLLTPANKLHVECKNEKEKFYLIFYDMQGRILNISGPFYGNAIIEPWDFNTNVLFYKFITENEEKVVHGKLIFIRN